MLEAWGVPEYAEMVHALLNNLQIEKADVIGHSFGGRIIIYLASQYPNLFDKIVLTDAAGVKPKKKLSKQIKIYSYKFMKNILKIILPKEKYETKITALRAKYGSNDYSNLQSDIMRKTFQNVIALDLTPNLSKITRPVLLMWGEKDEDTPLYMANIMAQNIPDSGLVVLPEAGHFSYLDATASYLKIVETFLGGK